MDLLVSKVAVEFTGFFQSISPNIIIGIKIFSRQLRHSFCEAVVSGQHFLCSTYLIAKIDLQIIMQSSARNTEKEISQHVDAPRYKSLAIFLQWDHQTSQEPTAGDRMIFFSWPLSVTSPQCNCCWSFVPRNNGKGMMMVSTVSQLHGRSRTLLFALCC